MTWSYDAKQRVYSVTEGVYHSRVWRHLNDTWIAMVFLGTTTTTQEDFPTAEEAIAWCEEHIAEHQAGEHD